MGLFSMLGFGQKSDDNYFGSIDDTRIKLKLNEYALSNDDDAIVELIEVSPHTQNNIQTTESLTKECFDLAKYHGIRFYEVEEKVKSQNIETSTFIEYYNSLSDEYKNDLLFVSQISYKPCSFIKNNKAIQEFILKKYNDASTKRSNQLKSYKVNFLILIDDENRINEIDKFLTDLSADDYFYHNDKFLLFLINNEEEIKAITHFENLVFTKILNYEKLLVNEPTNSLISLSNFNLDCEFLFNPKTRSRYIETCIKAIESNAFGIFEIMNNIQLLWRSNLLSEIQKNKIVDYCRVGVRKHSEFSKLSISQLQDCFNNIIADYYGFEYLLNYKELGYFDEKFDFPAFEIQRIVGFKKLNPEQKEFIIKFVKDNYKEEKIHWDYFDGTQWIMTHLTDFTLMDSQITYDENEIRNYLSSKSLLDTITNCEYEKELVKQAYRIDILRPIPLNKYVWSLIGDNIPEIWFDMEVGKFPIDYNLPVSQFVTKMNTKLDLVIEMNQNIEMNNNEATYTLKFNTIGSSKGYKIVISNSSAWYSVNSIINVLNFLCMDNGKSERWINIETGDQIASYILVNPKVYDELNNRFNLKDKYK